MAATTRRVCTLQWGTAFALTIALGCAGTAERAAREPGRHAPGVAGPPAGSATPAALVHRPDSSPDSAAAAPQQSDQDSPACPIFDPFSAEERLRRALEPLMLGDEEAGRKELLLALCQEPDDPNARDLLRQLDVAPEKELGTEFVAYRVQAGDSLPGIAKRALGSPYRFYVLARYNRIEKPGLLTEGQCLRVPGNPQGGASQAAADLASCGAIAEREGNPTLAYAYFSRGLDLEPGHPDNQDGLSRVGDAAAEVYRRDAVRALREQDLAAACWNCDMALRVRPNSVDMVTLHDTAEELGQQLANALYREALAAYARGDRAEVLANCGRVLELDPDHAGADQLLQQAAAMANSGQ